MFAFGSWQGTAGFQRLELTVANVETTGYHCKELPVPRGWNAWFPTWEQEVTIASNCPVPTWEPPEPQVTIAKNFQILKVGTDGSQRGNQKVTMARNCRCPDLETYGSQPGNQRLPLQGIAGSRKLEFMFSKLSSFHCKELRVPKAWNSWFQAWKSNITSGRICWLQKDRTHGS